MNRRKNVAFLDLAEDHAPRCGRKDGNKTDWSFIPAS